MAFDYGFHLVVATLRSKIVGRTTLESGIVWQHIKRRLTHLKISVLFLRLSTLTSSPDLVIFAAPAATLRDQWTLSHVELGRLPAPRLVASAVFDGDPATFKLEKMNSISRVEKRYASAKRVHRYSRLSA